MTMVAYWQPKGGTSADEWEDGAAYDPASGWFAVTDGASTGSSSREWAFTLADSFVRSRPVTALDDDAAFLAWVRDTRAAFDPRAPAFAHSRMPAWVQSAGERLGAYATFVGGRIAGGEVRAVAVGDCCLFTAPAGTLPVGFPIAAAGGFGTSPMLIASVAGDDEQLCAAVHRHAAPVNAGDVVFAASDALADWLTRHGRRAAVWRVLAALGHQGFAAMCADLRAAGELKNDDVTLFRATV